MDNMAYLQQIAAGNNSAAQKANKKGFNILSKIFSIWTLIAVVIITVVAVAVVAISNAMNQVDVKDRELMQSSYWMSTYLVKNSIGKYERYVKNSDLRNMSASFTSILNEINLNEKNLLLSEYKIKLSNSSSKKTGFAKKESDINTQLNSKLEDGRLSGTLDRVYLREMTMQIANMRSYQSEIAERTKNKKIREFSLKAHDNLNTLYKQFHDFKNLAL